MNVHEINLDEHHIIVMDEEAVKWTLFEVQDSHRTEKATGEIKDNDAQYTNASKGLIVKNDAVLRGLRISIAMMRARKQL